MCTYSLRLLLGLILSSVIALATLADRHIRMSLSDDLGFRTPAQIGHGSQYFGRGVVRGSGVTKIGVLRVVGGVLFQGEAAPTMGSEGITRYDLDVVGIGASRKLVLRVASHDFVVSDTPWLFLPIVRYVHNEYENSNSVVSLFGQGKDADENSSVYRMACRELGEGPPIISHMFIRVNKDLDGSSIGYLSLLADMLPIDDGKIDERVGDLFHPRVADVLELKYERSRVLHGRRLLQDAQDKHGRFSAYILTDTKTDYRFNLSGGRVVLSGRLHYHFWATKREGIPVARLDDADVDHMPVLNDELQSSDYIGHLNPYVMSTVNQAAQMAAFLRYLKKANHVSWMEFIERHNLKLADESRVETPRVWFRRFPAERWELLNYSDKMRLQQEARSKYCR